MECEDEKTPDEAPSTPSTLVIAPRSPLGNEAELPSQENSVPSDQWEEMPSESQEDLPELPHYDTTAVQADLNRRWETFRRELLKAGRTECEDGTIVNEAGDQSAASTE